MRVLILGIDGYLGWSLALRLASKGYTIGGIDNFSRRECVSEMDSHSALPIHEMPERLKAFEDHFKKELFFSKGDLIHYDFVEQIFRDFKPEAIVHLGENPSAPYSMIDAKHAAWTQTNNIVGTLNVLYAMKNITPQGHLIKLGTMGEYGTPNIDIPEGFFEIEYRGRKENLPFPRQAGSWYHQSKVHDSNNVMLACRIWGLRSSDIMQGIVYGSRILEMNEDDRLLTRLDFDQCFGTAINRFCCQAVVDQPLSPFGKGHQKRGFLPLKDSIQCLTLVIENPPAQGEYRVFNQFEEVYDITQLALKVKSVGRDLGLKVEVKNVENPRYEAEEHYYKPDHKKLLELGYQPTKDMEAEIHIMLQDLIKYRDRIEAKKEVLIPDIHWDGKRKKVTYFHGK